MKLLKRTLALMLVLCMMFTAVPFNAFATESTDEPSVPTTAPVDAPESDDPEEVVDDTADNTPDAVTPDNGIATASLDDGIETVAATSNRPANGTTTGSPFPANTAGSYNFRIPALVTLSDGTLVAAADARWNDIYDMGNIDTIVAYSKDKGANWNYTFANYIDDGGNTYNISAATFIDPAMAVKTVNGVETIYMVTDLFPGQANGNTMCIHAALYGTGMSSDGHLLVSDMNDNNLNDFHYYVGDYSNGFAPLCNSDGTATAYTVDDWFNVYKGNTLLGNLFTYGDAYDSATGKTFYVYQTSYLVLTKSTDGGKTWSAPTMLNHQVKNASEKFYGVGPASGFVTSTGRIMFTAYTFTTADGNSSVFYSDDNGATWTRSASVKEQTSEAALTEANGTIYMFTRHGCYYYYSTDDGTTWSGAQNTNGISYLDSCEVSVMTYSKKIDGKTAILLSAPTANGRYAGKIFVGLVNDDHSITWKYTYAVNGSGRYQYSSLKELNDGSLGLLYENGDASIAYKNIAITDVVGENAAIGTPEKNITLTEGTTKTFTLDEVVESGSHTSTAADVTWTKSGTTMKLPAAKLGTNTSFSGDTIDLNECLYTFTKKNDTWWLSADVNGTPVYIDAHAGAGNGGYPNRDYTTNITLKNGSNGGIQIYDGAGYLHFYDTDSEKLYWDQCTGNSCSGHNLKIYKVADTASSTVLGGYYEQVTDVAKLEDGGKYLIVGYNSSTKLSGYYAMHPSASTSEKYSHLAKITGDFIDRTTSETTVTIDAKSVGTTSVEIGGTTYNITVQEAGSVVVDKEELVELAVGQTVTYTDNTGNHESTYTGKGLDETIATVAVKGITVAGGTVETVVSSIVANQKYYIKNDNGLYLTYAGTSVRWTNKDEAVQWTAIENGNGFRLQNGDRYLRYSSGRLTTTTANYNAATFTCNSGIMTSSNNTLGTAVTDTTTAPVDATTVTITGVSKGKTSVIVGTTKYNIEVTIPEKALTLTTGGLSTIIPVAPVTQADIDAFNAANGAYVTAKLQANGNITLTAVAEGTVTDYLLGGTKYTINVIGAPNCVTSKNSPFVVGGNFIGSVDNDARNEGMDYLTKLTMSSVMTQENLGGGSSVGYPVELDSTFANAKNVSWSIADESIAKINVAADGKSVYVTAVAPGTTYLSCSIDGQVYSIPVVIIETTKTTTSGNWKYTSLHIAEITRTDVWYSWNCSGNTEQFIQAIEGEAIWTVFNKNEKYCINFYAAPDARHALTFMSATNSDGEYHTLADKENPKNCDFYTKAGAGYDERTVVGFENDQVAADIQAGLDLGCDGAQGFSRKAGADSKVNCNLTFISDPMPELEKTVNGILPTSRVQKDFRTYYDGMVATVGEYVYFELTVTLGRPNVWQNEAAGIGAITYTNAMLEDALKDAYFYTKEDDAADDPNGVLDGVIADKKKQVQFEDITAELNKAWGADETVRTLKYYVIYEIKTADIPKFIIENTATLEWDYKSHYSTGALDADAAAKATITVVGKAMDDVVIDFGQSFTYTGLTDAHLKYVTLGEHSSKYGKYSIKGVGEAQDDGVGNTYYTSYEITYTPTSILLAPDVIQMEGTYIDVETNKPVTKVINGFVVYPATTVYYEEGFMLNGDSTMTAGNPKKATGKQTFELLGESQFEDNLFTGKKTVQQHAYGYDPLYVTSGYDYGDSYITSKTIVNGEESNGLGNATTFTFTGTGFDLYANCTNATGTVSVQVKNAAGKVVKFYAVNTKVDIGDTAATTGQTGDEYHLPIVSEQGLAHGTYTVTITKIMQNGSVVLDGVRIFNTVKDSTVFGIDLEDNPEFYQLRNSVLTAINVDDTTSKDYGTLTEMANQVFNQLTANGETPAAVITDTNNIYGDYTAQDLLDNGPKNELFLYAGQTLTFKVITDREMQIGLKAPVQAAEGETPTSYTMTCVDKNNISVYKNENNVIVPNKSGTVNTSVDMFYPIGNPIGTKQEYTISITNTGSNILSVTDLKICDDPSFAFAPLTVDDIAAAMGVAEEPEVPETPVEPEVPETTVEPEVPETTVEPEVPETTKPSKPGNGNKPGNNKPGNNKPGNNKPETTKPTKPSKPTEPVVPETTTKPTEPEVPEVTVKPTEPQKPGKPGNNGNNKPAEPQKPGKDEKTNTLKITFVNMFGKKVGTATITTTKGMVSAYEISGKAPAGYTAFWAIPVALNARGNNSIVVPVI